MGRGIPGKLRQGLGRTSPPLRQGRIQRPCHRRSGTRIGLHPGPLQQYRRARALLQMSTADRLSLHNFAVAETRGEGFTETWGPMINALPVPLFPASHAHEDTNQKLLAQMANYTTTVTGAGSTKQPLLNVIHLLFILLSLFLSLLSGSLYFPQRSGC